MLSPNRQDPQGRPPMPQQGPKNSYEANRSMMNPTDVASMTSRGELSPQMTVREMFSKFGVDVDGPASQLAQFAKKQAENADPLKKMQNIAGGAQGPQGMPGRGMPQGQPQGQPGGLSQLAQMMGG